MNTSHVKVFERATLICWRDVDAIYFTKDGEEIKGSRDRFSGIKHVGHKLLNSATSAKLKEVGAIAAWNGIIALYEGEDKLIMQALEDGKAARVAADDDFIASQNITITKQNEMTVVDGENDQFSWAGWVMTSKATGKRANINEMFRLGDEAKAANEFLKAFDMLKKRREAEFEASKTAQDQQMEKALAPRAPNPALEALWSDVINEGGEGFNPYK